MYEGLITLKQHLCTYYKESVRSSRRHGRRGGKFACLKFTSDCTRHLPHRRDCSRVFKVLNLKLRFRKCVYGLESASPQIVIYINIIEFTSKELLSWGGGGGGGR